MKVVSVEDVRTRLDLKDETATNAILTQMIEGFSALIGAQINRKLRKATYKMRINFKDEI